jgi:hypothetical protein
MCDGSAVPPLERHIRRARRGNARTRLPGDSRHRGRQGAGYERGQPRLLLAQRLRRKRRNLFALPNAAPGQPYNEPQVAALLGISLTNPTGAWPATRLNVGVGGQQTNGAVWTDPDGDAITGVTFYTVPSGGISVDNSIPDPPYAYPVNSPDCPRTSGSARWSYKPWVGLENLTTRRITKFYVGMRTISQLQGTFTNCDTINGVVKGPLSGQMQTDARFQGCADDSPDNVCAPTLVDFFDTAASPIQIQPRGVVSASFTMKRVPNNHTCTDVRNSALPKP